MTRDYKLFIKDIADAIKDIEVFIGEMGYEEFLKDKKTQTAVVWQIYIVGEATKKFHGNIWQGYGTKSRIFILALIMRLSGML